MTHHALPIDDVLPEALTALRGTPSLVLRAPTGAGKTTRVPPALLDAGLARGGRILMLEPRRLAARAAARRMAFERGSDVGEEIGFHVRFDRRAGARTRILVVTEGLLVRMLQDDPFLDGVGAVIFDEFHERNLDSDLALALVRKLQREVRPELCIVVMSATLASHELTEWLAPCTFLESAGRLYPVSIRYAAAPDTVPLPRRVADGVRSVFESTAGGVLAFLPGVGEIRRTRAELEPYAQRVGALLVDLYGDLAPEAQDAALAQRERRKIVLATNVAETSVTVEGITGVVDSGFARVLRFDPAVGLDRLELSRISRSSADQRAGRAGRTEAGVCLRLWSEREDRGLRATEEPEIQRVDLARAVLELLASGEPDPVRFPWFEAPPPASLERAASLLELLGATANGRLTTLGCDLARLPAHPRVGRLLLEGARLGVAEEAALAGALLMERDPFRVGARSPHTGHARRAKSSSDSDVFDRVRALDDFDRGGSAGNVVGELNAGAARGVLRARDALLRELDRKQRAVLPHADAPDVGLGQALLAAYPDRVARRREAGSPRGVLVGGRGVRLDEASAVHDAELFVCVDIDAGARGERAEALVRQASAVEREWLPESSIATVELIRFDAEHERVSARRRTSYHDLVLSEVDVALPSSAEVEAVLAEAAAARPERALALDDPEVQAFLNRVRALRGWMPELGLPSFDATEIAALIPEMCAGARSFADLRKIHLAGFLKAKLDRRALEALDREAPERLRVPSGSWIRLDYEPGRPPVLAVRIQELFGWADTPRIAAGRVRVLLHLLAPNHRPQQITDDLQSFWNKTYPAVQSELRRRYPRHAWPLDPWNAVPERRPKSRPR